MKSSILALLLAVCATGAVAHHGEPHGPKGDTDPLCTDCTEVEADGPADFGLETQDGPDFVVLPIIDEVPLDRVVREANPEPSGRSRYKKRGGRSKGKGRGKKKGGRGRSKGRKKGRGKKKRPRYGRSVE